MSQVQAEAEKVAHHIVTIEEAKEQIAELVEAVIRGEYVFIVKDDDYAVELSLFATPLIQSRINKPKRVPKPGSAKGTIIFREDWMEPDF